MDIPVLQTARLLLRGHRTGDFPAFAAMRADPAVMRFIGNGRVLGAEDAWSRFLGIAGHWELMKFGTWAIEELASGEMIGALGFADKKRPASHPASGAPEVGWSLAGSAQGKGFASEALGAVLAWGADFFGAGARTVCVVSDGNDASMRLAERHGFRPFATASRYGIGRRVFERRL
ncbi:MAG TPA: GNAT family N-acetyltransferase [Rhizomicrobium sp.]|nr:GNAT family N-acetyltransferase [Rhizomicrobium sp.]